ncbi:MAG: NADH-quinone oxidoreductase subunit NuoB [Candidatus Aminicenantes bacterium]|nr:NADH-quinone oxidoreductase subunit NuoB [Candidatus Aminicenantes bacterium]
MPGILAKAAAKAFPKSLWLYHCNSGACNGCDIEILNVLTPYYDVERFGLKLVGSPRHADVMLLSGAVTRPTLPLVKRAYEAMPAPKLVFGIGSCAAGGGCWFDTYNVAGGGATAVPVDYLIPGCPPRPEAIIYGVALALGLVPQKAAPVELKQVEFPIDAYLRNKAWEERNVIYKLIKD